MIRTRWLKFVYALVALVLVGGAVAIVYRQSPPPSFEFGQEGAFDLQRTYWQGRVQAVGGVAAYREFSRFVSQNPVFTHHQLAHAFGQGLYNVEGEQGVSVCDEQFSYGCFHVVLGKAITDRGLSEVSALDAMCRAALLKSPEACEHGIGHGIAAYLGYTEEALRHALATCDILSQPTGVLSCYSGVFMEYNTHTMLGESALPRPVVTGKLFAPCDTLASTYQGVCAFWQAQWWMHGVYSEEMPDEELYYRVGGLCDRLGSTVMVRSCYQGLGNITPQNTGYSPAASAVLCRASTASKLHQLYCISYAANVIGIEKGHAEGRQACTELSTAGLSYCLEYANVRATMFHDLGAPAEDSL